MNDMNDMNDLDMMFDEILRRIKKLLSLDLYVRVPLINGETEEPVNFVGVHPLQWTKVDAEYDDPKAAFRPLEPKDYE